MECLSMHPYRGIVHASRRSDGISTIPDNQNTLTPQSADTNDPPQGPSSRPSYNSPLFILTSVSTPFICEICSRYGYITPLLPPSSVMILNFLGLLCTISSGEKGSMTAASQLPSLFSPPQVPAERPPSFLQLFYFDLTFLWRERIPQRPTVTMALTTVQPF